MRDNAGIDTGAQGAGRRQRCGDAPGAGGRLQGIVLHRSRGQTGDRPRRAPPSNLVRHIRPDSIVTMEYVFARLNIEIDTKGAITAVRCG